MVGIGLKNKSPAKKLESLVRVPGLQAGSWLQLPAKTELWGGGRWCRKWWTPAITRTPVLSSSLPSSHLTLRRTAGLGNNEAVEEIARSLSLNSHPPPFLFSQITKTATLWLSHQVTFYFLFLKYVSNKLGENDKKSISSSYSNTKNEWKAYAETTMKADGWEKSMSKL